eukprot:TRINITY_DN12302_c0_g6_i1.p2 TRINITY_DN12302_c0_g6~~TRINITY_DN12302_c0_g6_i1.p2  ORF type:complete len:109 (+),score=9.23 TRINITY_DN12302_c0_g6_i1:491-817(+)
MPYWSFTSPHACSLWLALDDAAVQNGCMYFLKGSHREVARTANVSGHFEKVAIGSNMRTAIDQYPALLRGYECVPSVLTAGDCSIHNGMVMHAAGPDMTPYRRRAMTI